MNFLVFSSIPSPSDTGGLRIAQVERMPVSRRILISLTLVLVMLQYMLYTYSPSRSPAERFQEIAEISQRAEIIWQARRMRIQANEWHAQKNFLPTRGLDADVGHSAEIQGQKEECSWPCYLERYRDVRVTLGKSNPPRCPSLYLSVSQYTSQRRTPCISVRLIVSQCASPHTTVSRQWRIRGADSSDLWIKAAWHYNTHGKREGRDCTCGGATACAVWGIKVLGRTVCQRHTCSWVCYLKTYPTLLKEFGASRLSACLHLTMSHCASSCITMPHCVYSESCRPLYRRDNLGTGGEGLWEAAARHYETDGKAENRDCTCAQAPVVGNSAEIQGQKEECSWPCYLERYRDVQKTLGKSNPPRCPSLYLSMSQYTSQRRTPCISVRLIVSQCASPPTTVSRQWRIRGADKMDVFTKAAWHYNTHGKREGRDCTCGGAHRGCSWVCYLKNYPALLNEFGASRLSACLHLTMSHCASSCITMPHFVYSESCRPPLPP